MRLYLTAKTAMKDLVIEYIEVRLTNGKEVTLSWDESEFGINDGVFTARYKGVYFDDVYGNGLYEKLRGMQITEIGVYSDNNEPVMLAVTHLTVEDELDRLDFCGLLYQEGDFDFTVPRISASLHCDSNFLPQCISVAPELVFYGSAHCEWHYSDV